MVHDDIIMIQKDQFSLLSGRQVRNLCNFTEKHHSVISQFLRHGFLNVNITDNGSMLDYSFLKLDLEKYRTDLVY